MVSQLHGVSLLPGFWLWVLSIFVVFHLLRTTKKTEEMNSVIGVSWWGSKEIAWWVKPCKHEDPELNPQNPWKTKPTNWI